DPGVLGLEDRVGGEPRWHEDHRGVGADLVHRLVERVEDRNAIDVLAALAGGHAAYDLRAVVAVTERVEGALAAGDPGGAQAGLLINQDAHAAAASSTTFLAAPSIVDSV